MNITEHEMRGLLAGKCLPGDMRVNEELPAYLVRKFAEAKAERDALAKQEPVHFRPFGSDGETYVKCSPDHIDAMAFWQHPAPAADLAELVEDEANLTAGVNALVDCLEDCGDAEQGLRLALRAILRKIEEVKK